MQIVVNGTSFIHTPDPSQNRYVHLHSVIQTQFLLKAPFHIVHENRILSPSHKVVYSALNPCVLSLHPQHLGGKGGFSSQLRSYKYRPRSFEECKDLQGRRLKDHAKETPLPKVELSLPPDAPSHTPQRAEELEELARQMIAAAAPRPSPGGRCRARGRRARRVKLSMPALTVAQVQPKPVQVPPEKEGGERDGAKPDER
eukprot:gnl/Dysnectes_brevis/5182_a7344_397.p1 GENE.gnl/Dysnectes_brevis/5182_a7344_397~~gnl/Dysnectes_brevis/5182_a7344_397.p1  ORF type:complete len:200 (-),score=31.27 gnl/Dysnectes_brevis/5182_a7344_397:188-787(-)